MIEKYYTWFIENLPWLLSWILAAWMGTFTAALVRTEIRHRKILKLLKGKEHGIRNITGITRADIHDSNRDENVRGRHYDDQQDIDLDEFAKRESKERDEITVESGTRA